MFARRPRVTDVAARAGVSTATVDRVLNGRGGVRAQTVEKVERAARELMNGGAARAVAGPFEVMLPAETGRSTEVLAEEFERAAACRGVALEVVPVPRYDPDAVAERLDAIADKGAGAVAVQAVDHPLVREGLARVSSAGIPVVTVCTELPGVEQVGYVGMDNRTAGRVSGLIMGRFSQGRGKVVVVWGGQMNRSHEARESGFRAILRAEFPGLSIVEELDGKDDATLSLARFAEALERHPDLAGVYCVGGGQRGVAVALEAAGLAARVTMVGHNCNAETRPLLVSGAIDAVIHQDMARIADATLDRLLDPERSRGDHVVPCEIVTRENLRYRQGGQL